MKWKTVELVKSYFVDQGYVTYWAESDEGLISFSDGRSKITVKIVEDVSSGKEFLSLVVDSVLTLKDKGVAYLAIPRKLSSYLDLSVLKYHGIGVLSYDRLDVEEIYPPKYDDRATVQEVSNGGADSITIMVNSIMERVCRLERVVKDLEILKDVVPKVDKLEKLYHKVLSEISSLKVGTNSIDTTKVAVSNERIDKEQESRLPSFLEGNPWVDILSKRAG